jgi:integrating conjugative element protein (TIGR03765 family)
MATTMIKSLVALSVGASLICSSVLSVSPASAQNIIKSKSVRTNSVKTTNINSNNVREQLSELKQDEVYNVDGVGNVLSESTKRQIIQKLHGGNGSPLKVLHDSGNTVSIDNYYLSNPEAKPQRQVKSEIEEANKRREKNWNTPKPQYVNQIIKGHFPVKAEVITLSSLGRKQILRDIPNLEHNMFVVGDDEYSMEWLSTNKEELLRFGAVGILTQVSSSEKFKEILEFAKPLSLMPVSADFITENFGVTNYPVLITQQGEFR